MLRERRLHAGFTLIELLVVIAVISILMGLAMPGLARARATARSLQCTSNLRQLGYGWQTYADENNGYCMPQAWSDVDPAVYWWGTNGDPADHTRGLIYPYLGVDTGVDTVFDCPQQPFGTYIAQGVARGPTTTYGYNGLYLCPPHSRWEFGIATGAAGWLTSDQIESASRVFVFADTLLDYSITQGRLLSNNCLLDGPETPGGSSWRANRSPTLCFRHNDAACVFFADSHVERIHRSRAHIVCEPGSIGYVGEDNAPHYVPNRASWFR